LRLLRKSRKANSTRAEIEYRLWRFLSADEAFAQRVAENGVTFHKMNDAIERVASSGDRKRWPSVGKGRNGRRK